jgi:hypothetical protein
MTSSSRQQILGDNMDDRDVGTHFTLGDIPPRFVPESSLLALLGEKVRTLHGPLSDVTTSLMGGDVDCEVTGLDLRWPLRLPAGFRIVQSLHYDVRGWAWVLERDGAFAILDAIDDAMGINRLGFATLAQREDDPVASPARRAAYLTAKRIWKRQLDPGHWQRISDLAAASPSEFSLALADVFGQRVATTLQQRVQAGLPPPSMLWLAARTTQLLRRFNSPCKAFSLIVGSTSRVLERVMHPTGLYVLIVSTGSTLGQEIRVSPLADRLCGPLMRQRTIRGAATRLRTSEETRDDLWTLTRLWIASLLTHTMPIWWHRIAKGLIVIDGGWWELLTIDSLDERTRRVAAHVLALFLPKPDITVLVDAKKQVEAGEILLRALGPRAVVCRTSADQLATVAAGRALDLLESRALARLGGGWIELTTLDTRLILPRAPSAAVRTALRIHQRPTANPLVTSMAAIAAATGAFRFLARAGSCPPVRIRQALAEFIPPRSTLSVSDTSQRGRYIVAAVADTGAIHWVAKVATTPSGEAGLRREQTFLEKLARLGASSVRVPRVIAHRENLLLLEPFVWEPRQKIWRMPEEVAYSLGRIFRLSSSSDQSKGLVHGDCTPFNLRRSGRRWVLLDWECAADDGTLLDDMFTYILSGNAMLGRPGADEVVRAISGVGELGRTLDAYQLGAERRVDLQPLFVRFLERQLEHASSAVRKERLMNHAAARLLEMVRT